MICATLLIAIVTASPLTGVAAEGSGNHRSRHVVQRASVATDGGESVVPSTGPGAGSAFVSTIPAVSGDGRFVAFGSFASNLVPGDTNNASDVFVRDIQAGTVERVSIASDGAQGNGGSGGPSLSRDGRYVAFESGSTNFTSGTSASIGNVYVHDRVTGETTLVSIGSAGALGTASSRDASISADGRRVAFSSSSAFHPDDNDRSRDVFVHDLDEQSTVLASITTNGGDIRDGHDPALSANGRSVAFTGRGNRFQQAFLRDLDRQQTSIVSVSAEGAEADFNVDAPAISADGQIVAFRSKAANLVENDENDLEDFFARDREHATTTRISETPGGEGVDRRSHFSGGISVSDDGRFVAFHSNASNLAANDANDRHDVFLYDLTSDRLTRVSVAADGAESNDTNISPALSGNGRILVFQSLADNLVPDDTNAAYDIFIRGPVRCFTPPRSTNGNGPGERPHCS